MIVPDYDLFRNAIFPMCLRSAEQRVPVYFPGQCIHEQVPPTLFRLMCTSVHRVQQAALTPCPPCCVFIPHSWSLQQKLLAKNDSTPDPYYRSSVVMDAHDMLIGTVAGREITSSYVFKSFGKGWSLQQRLNAFNLTGVDLDDNSTYPAELKELTFPANFTADEKKRELTTRFSNPGLWGGHMIHNAGPIGGVQIRSQYRNGSCLLLWLSDHYLDGWDTAVLTVRAPDLTNDTFHPHCDQVCFEHWPQRYPIALHHVPLVDYV